MPLFQIGNFRYFRRVSEIDHGCQIAQLRLQSLHVGRVTLILGLQIGYVVFDIVRQLRKVCMKRRRWEGTRRPLSYPWLLSWSFAITEQSERTEIGSSIYFYCCFLRSFVRSFSLEMPIGQSQRGSTDVTLDQMQRRGAMRVASNARSSAVLRRASDEGTSVGNSLFEYA